MEFGFRDIGLGLSGQAHFKWNPSRRRKRVDLGLFRDYHESVGQVLQFLLFSLITHPLPCTFLTSPPSCNLTPSILIHFLHCYSFKNPHSFLPKISSLSFHSSPILLLFLLIPISSPTLKIQKSYLVRFSSSAPPLEIRSF